MPAKSKVVVKKSAKPASKSTRPAPAAAKTVVKAKTATMAKKAPPPKLPAKKPSPKAAKPAKPSQTKKAPPAKPVVKAKAKPPAPAKKGSPAVPKAAKKTKQAAPLKLKSNPPVKKSAPAKAAKPAPAKPAPAKVAPAKAAKPAPAPAKAASAKTAKAAPAKSPPAAVKADKPAPAKASAPAKAAAAAPAKAAPAKSGKAGKAVTPKGSGAAPALSKGFNAGPHLKSVSRRPFEESQGATIEIPKVVKSTPFLKKQKQRLFELRSLLLDSMESVADGSLRSRPEGSEASAFGQHMADAGSDAYDRDFALSLLSQEQDSLYEINEALKRIDIGTYGICEMSGKPILEIRLEALPFARFTVECQAQLEREGMGGRHRRPVRSLFGLEGETDGDSDGDDEEETETVDNKQE